MSDIQVVSVGLDVLFFSSANFIAEGLVSEYSKPIAVSRYDSMCGLPCKSQIIETKKTSSMYLTPPVGYNLLSVLWVHILIVMIIKRRSVTCTSEAVNGYVVYVVQPLSLKISPELNWWPIFSLLLACGILNSKHARLRAPSCLVPTQ